MRTAWQKQAIANIQADFQRSADTHLIKLQVPAYPDIDLYLKDESTHPSGSLKHRLARSLFLYGICSGWIEEHTPIVEASSGSTAISEAYFARMLGLDFHTVIPADTSKDKIQKIEFLGGQCHLVKAHEIYREAENLAQKLKGHYMDQFTFAERAMDWRGNNSIAESLFKQLSKERFPEPSWVVVGAGTGGTSATIGRFIRYQNLDTRLCVADPENSVLFDFFHSRDRSLTSQLTSRIEGIGLPRVEPSFIPEVVDKMIQVQDAASIASILVLKRVIDRRCGASTGTNLWAALEIMEGMQTQGEKGSLVTLLCDSGERYRDTYYNPDWLKAQQLDPAPFIPKLEKAFEI